MNTRNDAYFKLPGYLLRIAILISLSMPVSAQQLSIKGPSCVRIDVEYQYIIEGNTNNLRSQVCLKGGAIANTKQTCTGDSQLTEVRVVWTDVTSGSITVTIGGNSVYKTVDIVKELQAGTIDKSLSVRTIKEGSSISDINYTAAIGGGCNPHYVYQWQRSEDNLKWEDISGMNQQRFIFSSVPSRSLYYRRKVTDINSGTVAYTEPVAIFVEPDEKTGKP